MNTPCLFYFCMVFLKGAVLQTNLHFGTSIYKSIYKKLHLLLINSIYKVLSFLEMQKRLT